MTSSKYLVISFRVTEEDHTLIKKAMAIKRQKIASFVRTLMIEETRKIIANSDY